MWAEPKWARCGSDAVRVLVHLPLMLRIGSLLRLHWLLRLICFVFPFYFALIFHWRLLFISFGFIVPHFLHRSGRR